MRPIAPLTTSLLATALFSTMVFATVAHSQSTPPESVLPKPFTADQLVRTLRELVSTR